MAICLLSKTPPNFLYIVNKAVQFPRKYSKIARGLPPVTERIAKTAQTGFVGAPRPARLDNCRVTRIQPNYEPESPAVFVGVQA